MLIDGRHQRTIGVAEDGRAIDQRMLPHELAWAELRTLEDAAVAWHVAGLLTGRGVCDQSEPGPRCLFP